MDIYVYSDESGVFDVYHNKYFVYGGILFLDKDTKNNYNRKFVSIERNIKIQKNIQSELKGNCLNFKYKSKIIRALNGVIKFGVIIKQEQININIFNNKKSKQRYLDFAFKIGLKNCLNNLIVKGTIDPNEIINIYLFVDEHTTATDGKYELRETLLKEFKEGMFNYNYQKFYKPLFPKLNDLQIKYCNSNKYPLIRFSDIIANYIYNICCDDVNYITTLYEKFHIKQLP